MLSDIKVTLLTKEDRLICYWPYYPKRFYDYFNNYTYGLGFFITMSFLAIFLLSFVQPFYRQRIQSDQA